MFVEAIANILKDRFSPQALRKIGQGVEVREVWGAIEEAGFLELLAPEEAGGAGLVLGELYPILLEVGKHAVPLPIGQTIAARAILSKSGGGAPAGMITIAPRCRCEPDGSLHIANVIGGLVADHVLVGCGDAVLLLDCSAAQRDWIGVHGSLSADLKWVRGDAVPIEGVTVDELDAWDGAVLAVLMAGAARRAGELTLQYCQDRSQFGRSIGKFQVIQHQLSVIVEHIAAMSVAAQMAFAGGQRHPGKLAAAVAKARCAEAVQVVAAAAHGLHGAIGITEEYDLQLLTRCLHEWRMAHGSELYWNRVVGMAMLGREGVKVSDFARQV